MSAPLVLLGPQRLRPTLRETVEALGVTGAVATVTAGWEEREDEDAELDEHLSGRTVNLCLFPRAEEVFAQEPEVHQAFLRRRDRMRELSDVHRPRLHAALQGARDLLRKRRGGGDAALLDPEIEHAIEAVRGLDEHHLSRVAAVEADFAAEAWADPRPSVQRHRSEVADLLAGAGLLAIAGGHVGILLNRLRLFDVLAAHGDRPVIAWS
ncbi:MAG: hypothetical protein O2816_17980, partial [Planctomycetota bacterium]|nr:hypothetical protein [Planctomycetota bacterium]